MKLLKTLLCADAILVGAWVLISQIAYGFETRTTLLLLDIMAVLAIVALGAFGATIWIGVKLLIQRINQFLKNSGGM